MPCLTPHTVLRVEASHVTAASYRPKPVMCLPQKFLSAYEAERYVKSLYPLAVSQVPSLAIELAHHHTQGQVESTRDNDLQVGSSAWMEQHDNVEKLNLQAHHNTRMHADEFVMEALLSYSKLSVLVHQLLVAEASLNSTSLSSMSYTRGIDIPLCCRTDLDGQGAAPSWGPLVQRSGQRDSLSAAVS